MTEKICLGMESTAHTFGVGIITDKGKILANEKDAFSTKQGGMIPNELADHHNAVKDSVVEKALSAANITIKDISLVSFSQGPGIAPALLVGMHHAKKLAKENNTPLVGVNHCIAHLEIGSMLTKAKDPVLLYASGANTQIIAYDAGLYRIFGETLDMGVGNFLDAYARYVGWGFPGGPKIEQAANKSQKFIELPYVVKGMDVSFSGLLTNVKRKYEADKKLINDLCYSLQETVFAMLVEVSERAMAHCDKQELVLGGGVACNTRLQEMCRIMCEERGASCHVPERPVLVDNGVMIAWQGILQQQQATKQYDEVDIHPYERTDDVIVSWK